MKIVNLMNIDNIKSIAMVVSNSNIKKQIAKENVDNTYKEKSHGIFENHLTDNKLRERFENIREAIKNNIE